MGAEAVDAGVPDHVRMLDLLGLADDEYVSGLEKRPGDKNHYGRIRRVGDLRRGDIVIPRDKDFWLSASVIDPTKVGPRSRGTSEDVVRIPAVWADLDLREGRINDIDVLWDVVKALADILGVNPVFVVMSGHGLQPYWRLEDDSPEDCARTRALLPRWGALVNMVAVAHGESRVDTVFDAARVLRTPGSRNFKNPADVVDVEFHPSRNWAPLSLDRIQETCDEYNVTAMEKRGVGNDDSDLTVTVSSASDWQWAEVEGSCGYVPAMVRGWRADVAADKVVAGHRHHWAFGQHIRLVAARRMGCVTQEEFAGALEVLQDLLTELRAPDGRAGARPGEVRADARWAEAKVALKSDAECWAELGGREHAHVDAHDLELAHSMAALPLPRAGAADPAEVEVEDPEPVKIPVAVPAGGNHGAPPEATLGSDFWDSTPIMSHIRQAAHASHIGAMGVLGAVLGRVSLLTHHTTELPADPNRGSLNVAIGLVGPSGGYKGSSVSVAERLLVAPEILCMCGDPTHRGDFLRIAPGSGEGLTKVYWGMVSSTTTTPTGGTRTTHRMARDRAHVMIDVDEIETMLALMGRQGSTLGGTIRTMWSGAQAGAENADDTKRHPIEAGSYRMALVAGVQPSVVDRLFGETMGGTPQRFVWFATDPRDSPDTEKGDVIPPWPGPLPVEVLEAPSGVARDREPAPGTGDWVYPEGWRGRQITVAPEVKAAMVKYRSDKNHGRIHVGPLDAHRSFNRLRVAALLARLHGEWEVTEQWWGMAERVMVASDATRDWMLASVAAEKREKNRAAGVGDYLRREAAREVADSVTVVMAKKFAKTVLQHRAVGKHGEDDCSSRCLSRSTSGSRWRDYGADAVEHALAREWIEETEEVTRKGGHMYRPGPEKAL